MEVMSYKIHDATSSAYLHSEDSLEKAKAWAKRRFEIMRAATEVRDDQRRLVFAVDHHGETDL